MAKACEVLDDFYGDPAVIDARAGHLLRGEAESRVVRDPKPDDEVARRLDDLLARTAAKAPVYRLRAYFARLPVTRSFAPLLDGCQWAGVLNLTASVGPDFWFHLLCGDEVDNSAVSLVLPLRRNRLILFDAARLGHAVAADERVAPGAECVVQLLALERCDAQ